MVDLWHIYYVKKSRHTTPPKDKYVAIVCACPNPYGFLINSKIGAYKEARPRLRDCQVLISAAKYGFLAHDSYIDCSQLFSFKTGELDCIQKIQNNTRASIKKVVSESTLIEPIYKKLIV